MTIRSKYGTGGLGVNIGSRVSAGLSVETLTGVFVEIFVTVGAGGGVAVTMGALTQDSKKTRARDRAIIFFVFKFILDIFCCIMNLLKMQSKGK